MARMQQKKQAQDHLSQQEQQNNSQSISNAARPSWDTYIQYPHPVFRQGAWTQPSVNEQIEPAGSSYGRKQQSSQHQGPSPTGASGNKQNEPAGLPFRQRKQPVKHSNPLPFGGFKNNQNGYAGPSRNQDQNSKPFKSQNCSSTQPSVNSHNTANHPQGNKKRDNTWAKPRKESSDHRDNTLRESIWATPQKKIAPGNWDHMDKERAFDQIVRSKNFLNDSELTEKWIKENRSEQATPTGHAYSSSDHSDNISDVSTGKTSVNSHSCGYVKKDEDKKKLIWDTFIDRTHIFLEGRSRYGREPLDKSNLARLRFPVTGGKRFPRFSELPYEIRIQIWKIADESNANKSEVRIKQVSNFKGGKITEYLFHAPPQRCHPLLLVCHESRSILLDGYKLMFGTPFSKPYIRFNLEKDRLFLDPNQIGDLANMAHGISPKDRNRIRRIAVPHREWTEDFKPRFYKAFVDSFRYCRELILYVADIPSHQFYLHRAENDKTTITRDLDKCFRRRLGAQITFLPVMDENNEAICDDDGAPLTTQKINYYVPNVRIVPMEGRLAIKMDILNPIT